RPRQPDNLAGRDSLAWGHIGANHLMAVAGDYVARVEDVDIPPAPRHEHAAITIAAVADPADVRVAQRDEDDAGRCRVNRRPFVGRDVDAIVRRPVRCPESGDDQSLDWNGPTRGRYLPGSGALQCGGHVDRGATGAAGKDVHNGGC